MANQIRPISPTDRWIVSDEGNVVGVQTSTTTDKGSSLFADSVTGDGDVADFAALLGISSPVAGQTARTIAPVIAGGTPYLSWVYDGMVWRLRNPAADLLVDYGTVSTGTATAAEQRLRSVALPPGLLSSLRYLRVYCVWAKSGTTDSWASIRVRLGAFDSVSDIAVQVASGLSAAGRVAATELHGVAISEASWRQTFSAAGGGLSVGGISGSAYPNSVSIPSTAGPLYLGMSAQLSGATDTPTLAHIIITGG